MSLERPGIDHDPRHAQAVANSLRLAGEAAARGDYVEALAWVDTVRAIGDDLPVELESQRSAWLQELGQGNGARSGNLREHHKRRNPPAG
jgi:hypothetical protein